MSILATALLVIMIAVLVLQSTTRLCLLGRSAGFLSHGSIQTLTTPAITLTLTLRLLPQVRGHPQLEAEVVYAARHEYCETATDFLLRRTRLAFVDIDAAEAALPRVRRAVCWTLPYFTLGVDPNCDRGARHMARVDTHREPTSRLYRYRVKWAMVQVSASNDTTRMTGGIITWLQASTAKWSSSQDSVFSSDCIERTG